MILDTQEQKNLLVSLIKDINVTVPIKNIKETAKQLSELQSALENVEVKEKSKLNMESLK